jgi:hypothetical protein
METFGDFAVGSIGYNILGLCQLLIRFYRLQDMESQFFSAEACDEVRMLSQTFAALYAKLAKEAHDSGVKMWKHQATFHLFQHLAEYMIAFQGNPRLFWTYQDEDLVGELIEVAQGVHIACLATGVLMKWIHAAFPDAE